MPSNRRSAARFGILRTARSARAEEQFLFRRCSPIARPRPSAACSHREDQRPERRPTFRRTPRIADSRPISGFCHWQNRSVRVRAEGWPVLAGARASPVGGRIRGLAVCKFGPTAARPRHATEGTEVTEEGAAHVRDRQRQRPLLCRCPIRPPFSVTSVTSVISVARAVRCW